MLSVECTYVRGVNRRIGGLNPTHMKLPTTQQTIKCRAEKKKLNSNDEDKTAAANHSVYCIVLQDCLVYYSFDSQAVGSVEKLDP